jgi:hypothetical protein
MNVFVVLNVARQVEGDLMVVKAEKGFAEKRDAEKYLASLPRQKTEVIKTEAGEIECFSVRGIYEVDVVGLDQEADQLSRADIAKLLASIKQG